MTRRLPIPLIVCALVAACASTPLTPTPTSPTATSAEATTLTTAAPTTPPTAQPSLTSQRSPITRPSPTPTPVLEGVWRSGRISPQMSIAALSRHGILPSGVIGHAFVDFMLYEVEIRDGNWTETEVPDGLPWSVGWTGTYTVVNATQIVAKRSDAGCEVTYGLRFSGAELAISVDDDSCAGGDLVQQIRTYESATFHKVQGEGAPQPELQTSGSAPKPTGPSTSDTRLKRRPIGTVDAATLGYLEYLPPGYGGAPSPLLVALHGSGLSGPGDSASLARLTEQAIPELISDDDWPDARPFVVLAPQHDARAPAVCITPAEIDEFLDFAIGRYNVDPTRVYLTGLSCGAIGAWNYLGEHTNEVVAAAVLVSGGGYGAIDAGGCAIGRVPIWAFHGVNDDVIPVRYDINSIARLQACSQPSPVDARLTLYADAGHDAWTRTYSLSAGNDIYEWLLGYSK